MWVIWQLLEKAQKEMCASSLINYITVHVDFLFVSQLTTDCPGDCPSEKKSNGAKMEPSVSFSRETSL